jgi:hypothetical protein
MPKLTAIIKSIAIAKPSAALTWSGVIRLVNTLKHAPETSLRHP